MIHGWHYMSFVLISIAGLPSFLISLFENLCCMHLHIKSWAWVESRLRIFLISKNPLFCYGVCRAGLDPPDPPCTACKMQHELERLGIEFRASSEITSRPPVAVITSKTPRSKRSSFLSSYMYGDSFFPESLSLPPGMLTEPCPEACWLKLVKVRNFSFSRFALFLKFSVPSQSSWVRIVWELWYRVLWLSPFILRMWEKPGPILTFPFLSNRTWLVQMLLWVIP